MLNFLSHYYSFIYKCAYLFFSPHFLPLTHLIKSWQTGSGRAISAYVRIYRIYQATL